MPHFLDIDQLDAATLRGLIERAKQLKAQQKKGEVFHPLKHKQLAMVFEKPSTRTRVSFEVGINQLGGQAVILDSQSTQLGRGESISDTANVLSRYVNLIMLRCYSHDTLLEMAKHASVPVINGLSDKSHPCQILADIMTFEEHRGAIEGKTIAWLGDGNNVTYSWIQAAARFGFTLNIATPRQLQPKEELIAWANTEGGKVKWTREPEEAVIGADAVTTDTWVSMGDADAEFRHKLLDSYRVNQALMQKAKKDAIFLHCLPAHRDEEVSANVIDGPQSVVFDEAENRLHVQKAVMLWCMGQ